jgi:hypothetical protein
MFCYYKASADVFIAAFGCVFNILRAHRAVSVEKDKQFHLLIGPSEHVTVYSQLFRVILPLVFLTHFPYLNMAHVNIHMIPGNTGPERIKPRRYNLNLGKAFSLTPPPPQGFGVVVACPREEVGSCNVIPLQAMERALRLARFSISFKFTTSITNTTTGIAAAATATSADATTTATATTNNTVIGTTSTATTTTAATATATTILLLTIIILLLPLLLLLLLL